MSVIRFMPSQGKHLEGAKLPISIGRPEAEHWGVVFPEQLGSEVPHGHAEKQ
jgi:hypothetical protein